LLGRQEDKLNGGFSRPCGLNDQNIMTRENRFVGFYLAWAQ
jgi:hypothetical protein